VRAASDPDSVSEPDSVKLFSLARVLFRRFENDFYQYRSGTFDYAEWEGYHQSFLREIMASPTMRAFWEQQRPVFASEFSAYVQDQLDSTSETAEVTRNSLEEWKAIRRRDSAV
jgi:hypothetical protein